jgi:hypothetical protein
MLIFHEFSCDFDLLSANVFVIAENACDKRVFEAGV